MTGVRESFVRPVINVTIGNVRFRVLLSNQTNGRDQARSRSAREETCSTRVRWSGS